MFDYLGNLQDAENKVQNEINEIRAMAANLPSLLDDLRQIRNKKAVEIRKLYFEKRVKQTDIAKMIQMRQGNVSKIISQQIYADAERYYR